MSVDVEPAQARASTRRFLPRCRCPRVRHRHRQLMAQLTSTSESDGEQTHSVAHNHFQAARHVGIHLAWMTYLRVKVWLGLAVHRVAIQSFTRLRTALIR